MDESSLLATQLGRMRSMTRLYHERFFSDVRFVGISVIGLALIGRWGVREALL